MKALPNLGRMVSIIIRTSLYLDTCDNIAQKRGIKEGGKMKPGNDRIGGYPFITTFLTDFIAEISSRICFIGTSCLREIVIMYVISAFWMSFS